MISKLLFEVSWEVCNKVGGIYTVITSKIEVIQRHFKGEYHLIGPFLPEKPPLDFVEETPPAAFKDAFGKLRDMGIKCHYGTWNVAGKPNTILIDITSFASQRNGIKQRLWDEYQIDSLNTEYYEFDQPVIWATAVGITLEAISREGSDHIIGHFHEWLAGAGLLYLKSAKSPISTVFTTHATMLGRSIAASGRNLYSLLDSINPLQEAQNMGIQAKHLMEVACAANATVFTTVSEITAIEAEKLLGRYPDVLLLNGLNIAAFPTFEERSIKHKIFKQKIFEFLLYYFFPYYSFDLSETLIFFTCARYEFRDKGIDIMIEALSRLNQRLKAENSKRTIVTFIWVPANISGIDAELLETRKYFKDLKGDIDDESDDIKNRLISALVAKKPVKIDTLLDAELLEEIQRKVQRLVRDGRPPLSTHNLCDPNDAVLQSLRKNGLTNNPDDRVKVIFYPAYLTGADSLLDTSYYESMLGSHLGIFPSYYEPWGYTPLECAALGTCALTTDVAGFGRYIAKKASSKVPGIYVLPRYNDDDPSGKLADIMHRFSRLNKQQRVKNKIEAKRLASSADWKIFIKNYLEAYRLAQ
ncbi:MAG: glycosyltransferase [archaeon]